MIRAFVPSFRGAGIAVLGFGALIFWGTANLPAMADGANPPPAREDFGQYLVDHQADLAPFFEKNAGDLLKQAVPLLMGLSGWIIVLTMLAGWVIDLLLSRGFAYFFAPAFAGLKRSIAYATGRLVLSVIYTVLMGVAVIVSLGLLHAGAIIATAIFILLVVGLAAQIVWILYLYRTDVPISAAFYLTIIVTHAIVGLLISTPLIVAQGSGLATQFMDRAVAPKLRAEVESTRHELAAARSSCNDARSKVADVQNQIDQAGTDQQQLTREIEQKKNSDAYVFSQIAKVRAQGDLNSARDQFAAFLAKFPSSSLAGTARAQLTQIDADLAAQAAQKAQKEADDVRAAAQAQADLLARAAKGEVTLSEMRQVLLGKTRAQVSSLFGLPNETASDSWAYRQQMIVNPLTNEKHGLMVYFLEGTVQSVDYYGNGDSR
jgi:hypothetical protein